MLATSTDEDMKTCVEQTSPKLTATYIRVQRVPVFIWKIFIVYLKAANCIVTVDAGRMQLSLFVHLIQKTVYVVSDRDWRFIYNCAAAVPQIPA